MEVCISTRLPSTLLLATILSTFGQDEGLFFKKKSKGLLQSLVLILNKLLMEALHLKVSFTMLDPLVHDI